MEKIWYGLYWEIKHFVMVFILLFAPLACYQLYKAVFNRTLVLQKASMVQLS